MTQLTLWQKLKFIEELLVQVNSLQEQINESNTIIEDFKHQKNQGLMEFEAKIKEDLRKQKKRENFLKELLTKQTQEKETYNQIVIQINSAIDSRLSDPLEFSKLNVDPSNPKEIELIKKALRQKLLARF
jgi:DNA repair exonuclease SbcCD ATPase subunit